VTSCKEAPDSLSFIGGVCTKVESNSLSKHGRAFRSFYSLSAVRLVRGSIVGQTVGGTAMRNGLARRHESKPLRKVLSIRKQVAK
jgi:hypothetical protein